MLTNTLETDVSRIQNALKTAHEAVKRFVPGPFAVKDNGGRGDPNGVLHMTADFQSGFPQVNARRNSPEVPADEEGFASGPTRSLAHL